MQKIEIENLEIKCIEFKNEISWNDANKESNKLGDHWRLPTIDELKKIYFYSVNKHNSKINNFDYSGWPIVWSAEDDSNANNARAMFFKDFYDGDWDGDVLRIKRMGTLSKKEPWRPDYRAGYITGNQKNYNARFIAVRIIKQSQ